MEGKEILGSLNEVITNLPMVPSSQNFWLNRTNDGAYYENFVLNNFVGLEFNDVSLSELDKIKNQTRLNNGRYKYDRARDLILDKLNIKYAKKLREAPKQHKGKIKSEITRKANQISNFVFGIKPGDFIVIPSHESKIIRIGRALKYKPEEHEGFLLTQPVEWIHYEYKNDLEPLFFKLFFTQLAFANINKYRSIILRTIYDFYIDNDEACVVLNIKQKNSLSAFDEASLSFYLLQLLDGFIKEYSIDLDINDIKTVVNLNSPGKRSYFGKISIVLLLGVITIAIVGGGVKSKSGDFDMSTDGLINVVGDYLDKEQQRELVEQIMNSSDTLSVARQEYLLRVLKEINND